MTVKMPRARVEWLIATAHSKNERPNLAYADLAYADLTGVDLSRVNLYQANLRGAYLRDTNLCCAHLGGANLAYANLADANLHGANLVTANLRSATLTGANLDEAKLHGANLNGAGLTGLKLDGLPSGTLTYIPTPGGWRLTVGCWTGTPDTLRELIAGDDDWPEARGKEITARRPALAAAADLCDVVAASHPNALAKVKAVADRWKEHEK